jgi:hypothetical protein
MTRNVLKGTCDKLVVAGKDVTPTCGDGLAGWSASTPTSSCRSCGMPVPLKLIVVPSLEVKSNEAASPATR